MQSLATLVLCSWPLVTLALFASLGREKGLIWSVVIGFLFLPEGMELSLPALPDYEKATAVPYSLLIAAAIMSKKRSWLQDEILWNNRFMIVAFSFLVFIMAVGAYGTVNTNGGSLVNGEMIRKGMTSADLRQMILSPILAMVPFFLACFWLRTARSHVEVLRVIMIGGLIYALPTLYEWRMSPQLNSIVYGYFPHSWLQHIRGGGFRPLVFLAHGLWLGFFLFSACAAAFALSRYGGSKSNEESGAVEPGARIFYLFIGFFLFGLTVLSRNMGATMLTLMFVPFILFTSRRIQARVAMLVAVLFLMFPYLRAGQFIPIDNILSMISSISVERAESLEVRFTNENDLIARAYEKPMFGWGLSGRWRIISEKGVDLTIVDSLWIILLGERGWVGFLSMMGMLVLPLLFIARVARAKKIAGSTTVLGLITAANLIYLLPNAMLGVVGWMAAGAVAGAVLGKRIETASQTATAEPVAKNASAYSRQIKYSRFNGAERARTPERQFGYRR